MKMLFMLGVWMSAQMALAQSLGAAATTTNTEASSKPDSVAALSTSVSPTPAADAKKFSGSLSVDRSNSLYALEGNSAVETYDATLLMAYSLDAKNSLTFRGDGSEDLKTPEASDFARARIGLSHKVDPWFGNRVLPTASTTWSFPVAREQNSESLIGIAGATLELKSNPDFMIWKQLDLLTSVSGSQYFHRYETSVAGTVNTKNSLSERLAATWNFNDKWSISALFDHFSTWSYQGALKESYAHNEELDYQMTSAWGFAVGYTYGNPSVAVRKPDGTDYNFNLADDQNSIVYGQVTYTF